MINVSCLLFCPDSACTPGEEEKDQAEKNCQEVS